MRGLLGTEFDDPKTQGLLTLGLALLNGRGNLGQALSSAGGQALEAYQGARQAQGVQEMRGLQKQLMEAQIGESKATAASKNAEAARRNALLDALTNFQAGDVRGANADVVAQTGNLAPTVGNAALQAQAMGARQQSNPLAGIPQQAIQADLAFNEGKNLSEWLMKRGTPQIEFVNGVAVDRNRVAPGTSLPNVTPTGQATQIIADPAAPGGYRVTVPQGAPEAYSTFRNIDAGIAASNELVEVYNPTTQRMERVPRSVALNAARGQAAPAPAAPPRAAPVAAPPGMQVPPQQQASADQERLRILMQERARETDPANQRALDREIQSTRASLGAAAPPVGGGAMGLASGPSARETQDAKVGTEARTGINDNWIKGTYQPVIDAGGAAGDALTAVQSARIALQGLGGTGFGTEARVAAARVLGSLGVQNAEKVAASGAMFQQAASERLFVKLAAQKGVATDKDAEVAKQTFINLRDPELANQFTLDLTQAIAEKDRLRANFYRDALPRAGNDLTAVDRAWMRVDRSVFDMPTMQRWRAQNGNAR